MTKRVSIFAFVVLFCLPILGFSASFQVYPGARLDGVYETKQSDIEAKISKAPKVIVFTTHDPFESVVAFYRGIVREYRLPRTNSGSTGKLSSGQELKEAYFIFDNATDLSTSKHWVKIQQPYTGIEQARGTFQGRYQPARQVTAIIEEDKRTYP